MADDEGIGNLHSDIVKFFGLFIYVRFEKHGADADFPGTFVKEQFLQGHYGVAGIHNILADDYTPVPDIGSKSQNVEDGSRRFCALVGREFYGYEFAVEFHSLENFSGEHYCSVEYAEYNRDVFPILEVGVEFRSEAVDCLFNSGCRDIRLERLIVQGDSFFHWNKIFHANLLNKSDSSRIIFLCTFSFVFLTLAGDSFVWKKILDMPCLIILSAILSIIPIAGNLPSPDDYDGAVLLLSGASVIEELSDEEMEKYRRYVSMPLDINSSSFSRLKSCGLLSEIQAVSIISARRRSGDILSWNELSLLDGFSSESARALSRFAVLRSSRPPGQREDLSTRQELTVRGMVRTDLNEADESAGLKYSFKLGERAGLNWATRNTYDDSDFGLGTLSAVWYGSGHIGKIVAGDIALRFGQGLSVWTGFSLSGLSSIQSYRRNPTGISQTSSFNSEHKGFGIDFNIFPHISRPAVYTVSVAYSVTGKLPVVNLTRIGKLSSLGLTATSSSLSTDFKVGAPLLSFFGEACWNYPNLMEPPVMNSGCRHSVSAVAGMIWLPEYGRKVGVVARFAENKLQPAAGYESTMLKVNFEGKVDYSKMTEMYKATVASGDSLLNGLKLFGAVMLRPSFRLSCKLKPREAVPLRADLRMDLDLVRQDYVSSVSLNLHSRTDLEYSRTFSWQTYLEGGYTSSSGKSSFSVHVRTAFFHVDNWDDRIYVHERDIPGTFTCPALYGRGMNASVLSALKFKHGSPGTHTSRNFSHTVSLKLSSVNYFMDKPCRLECKLQYSLQL